MTIKNGYIPEEVIYVCRQPTSFQTHWDGTTWCSRIGKPRTKVEQDIASLSAEEISLFDKNVISTFPVSADPKNLEDRLKTAREWAKIAWQWDRDTYTPSIADIYKEIRLPNKPFTVQVVGLDIRDQGGRAYKVIDTEGHLFDLREDMLFESLMKFGALPDGHLSCEFLWCVSNHSMKLIREGSVLHQQMLEAGNRREKKVLDSSELIPGKVYQSKGLNKKLFLGWIPSPRSKKYKLLWIEFRGNGGLEDFKTRLEGKPRANSGYAEIDAAITSEHSMIEEIGDFSDIQHCFLPFVEADFDKKVKGAKVNLNYWGGGAKNPGSYAEKQALATKRYLATLENQTESLKNLLGELP